MSTSTHDHVADLLPWLVNGTLEADERLRVEEHLARCDACRGELDATRSTFELYATHLPPWVLTAYAEDPGARRYHPGDGPPLERALVDAHLAHCPTCREELELARASRAALEEEAEAEMDEGESRRGGVVAFRPPGPAAAPSTAPLRAWAVALAASLLFAIVAAGGWFFAGQRLDDAERRMAELEQRLTDAARPATPALPSATAPATTAPDGPTASDLEAARQRSEDLARTVDELEGQVAAMERQVDRLAATASAPRSGVRYVVPSMLSGGDVLRGAGDEDGAAAPSAPADGWVYLAPELPPSALRVGNRFDWSLRDEDGAELLTGRLEVAEDPAIGPYVSLVLPTADLPAGPLTLVLSRPQGDELARYGFVVGG